MNKNTYILIITLLLVLCQFAISADIPEDKTASWKAGVASVTITPKKEMWMAGYASRTHPSEGILHDLKAKAIVFEDEEGKQSVLVTTDLLGFPKALSDSIRNSLKMEFGFSRLQIILNSSHTHSGPVLRGGLVDIYPIDSKDLEKINQYSDWLQVQIVALVGRALNLMQPVKLYAGNGLARFQVNRRNNDEKTLSKQNELNGPNDYSVPVLKVVNNKNKLVSIIFGYGCHPTVLNGYDWSGDYPGFAQIELEKFYPGATAFFFQGSGADQNPLPRRTIPLAIQYGKDLAIAVERVLAGEMEELAPKLEYVYSEIELSLINQPTIEELLKMEESSSDYQKRWATRLISKIKNGEELQKSYSYPVQVWSLGELPIISLGGELVTEYSLELRRILGHHIFVLGYSNDVMAYIPSSTILMEGGYEAASSQIVYGLPGVWAPSIEVQILHEILQLVEKVNIPLYSETNLSKD